ncbi:MAG: efflux RND transporter periplasmic adaptor subunit [Candidatus Omnitrophota bacterium]|jgi:RND family efflux transporter MFP subunit|nr:MAG: efflux RND transporter periplasmic adaptor subunit [Candidatus Omnitrophota bacterium]
MKRIRLFIILLFGITLLTGCGYFSGGNRSAMNVNGTTGGNWGKPEKPKFKIPVTAQRIERGRMYAYLQAVGTIVPIREVEIKPEMTARIYYTQRWMEGDEVKKGTIFASMDDRELKLNINEQELQLKISEARIEPASANLEQAIKDEGFKEAMYKRGAVSKAEFDQAVLTRIQRENSYEETLKNVEARVMSLAKMKQEIEKVAIIIPFDGVLLPAKQSLVNTQREGAETDLTLMNGLMVGQSSVLCRLANIDQVNVALDVPAKDLMEIKIDQDVELEIYSRSGAKYRGKVKEMSTALNANTRTYTVNVLVDNPKHELRPGMFAKAQIITEERVDAISIPRNLLNLQNNEQVVYIVKEKPAEEVKNATGETRVRPPESRDEPAPIAKSVGFEKVALAADQIADTTPEEEEIEEFSPAEEIKPAEIPMIAERRVVSTGIENREAVEIVEGLKEGELLVILGYETLTDGVDVNVTVREKEDRPAGIASSGL